MPSRSSESRTETLRLDAIALRERIKRVFIAVGAAPFLLIVLAFVPAPDAGAATIAGIPTLCLFRRYTGIPCPGCGITRSLVCCAHGNFADAIHFHLLGPLVFAGLIFVSLQHLPTLRRISLPQSLVTISGYIGLVLIFGVWIVRLAGWVPLP